VKLESSLEDQTENLRQIIKEGVSMTNSYKLNTLVNDIGYNLSSLKK